MVYFNKNHVIKNSTWYEGAEVMVPSTNNHSESFNSVVKRVYCKRNKMTLINFFPIAIKMLLDSNNIKVTQKINYENKNTYDIIKYLCVENYKGVFNANKVAIHWFCNNINDVLGSIRPNYDDIFKIKKISILENYFKKFTFVIHNSIEITSFDVFHCSCYTFFKK